MESRESIETRNALHGLVRAAVSRSRSPAAEAIYSGAGGDGATAVGLGSATSAGVDGGGNPITVHVMIWDVDDWDDPGSDWSV